MSVHVEWDTAKDIEVQVMNAAEANENLSPDEEVTAPAVLVLGGAGGGALAAEGTLADLESFAWRVLNAIGAAMNEGAS